MNLMKKKLPGFVSSIPSEPAVPSFLPPLVHFESLFFTALQGIRNYLNGHTKVVFQKNPHWKAPQAPVAESLNFPVTPPPIPIIKASTIVANSTHRLSGQYVLCVGGQMQLYPAYQQIVEDESGYFLSFYGGADDPMTDLRKLLARADMVICPIDCIRHEAFFITRNYCQYSRKPCVMLDKSRISTFYNGIRVLKKLQ